MVSRPLTDLECDARVIYPCPWFRFPFYWEIKTLFLLYLALPQTQVCLSPANLIAQLAIDIILIASAYEGSTFIYKTHLAPTLHEYEPEIDSALASLKSQVYAFLQAKVRTLWEHVSSVVVNQATTPTAQPGQPTQAPPTLADPVSGPAQMVWGLWRAYAPTLIAKGNAMLAETQPHPNLFAAPSTDPSSVLARRRQLEAELANLPSVAGYALDGDLSPAEDPVTVKNAYNAAASVYLPDSKADGSGSDSDRGRYEQIGRDDVALSDKSGSDDGGPPSPTKSGWFGWGSTKAGYTKLKDE